MEKRLELHEKLCDTLGSRQVYFQPPPSIKMLYPCIVYTWSRLRTRFANGRMYAKKKEYTVTVIDPNPDSSIPDRVLSLPFCSFNRHFTADNLNHDVFQIHY